MTKLYLITLSHILKNKHFFLLRLVDSKKMDLKQNDSKELHFIYEYLVLADPKGGVKVQMQIKHLFTYTIILKCHDF